MKNQLVNACLVSLLVMASSSYAAESTALKAARAFNNQFVVPCFAYCISNGTTTNPGGLCKNTPNSGIVCTPSANPKGPRCWETCSNANEKIRPLIGECYHGNFVAAAKSLTNQSPTAACEKNFHNFILTGRELTSPNKNCPECNSAPEVIKTQCIQIYCPN